ncbi:hypothetical protein CRENBAI_025475 [Crenichthys baileyi]|uniref:Secreted protein n=1 Tax=Crenichthys baileyi TaxID=28760 RepID=A0AAV9SFZ2_9TELE
MVAAVLNNVAVTGKWALRFNFFFSRFLLGCAQTPLPSMRESIFVPTFGRKRDNGASLRLSVNVWHVTPCDSPARGDVINSSPEPRASKEQVWGGCPALPVAHLRGRLCAACALALPMLHRAGEPGGEKG